MTEEYKAFFKIFFLIYVVGMSFQTYQSLFTQLYYAIYYINNLDALHFESNIAFCLHYFIFNKQQKIKQFQWIVRYPHLDSSYHIHWLNTLRATDILKHHSSLFEEGCEKYNRLPVQDSSA